MKKLLSLTLALIMVLTLSIAVFAEESQDASFGLKYKLENDNTSNPAETFTFEFTNGQVTDAAAGVVAPEIPDATVPFDAGAATLEGLEKSVQVALSGVSFPSVGIYTYNVHQKEGTTAGVTYSDVTAKLKVTVARDETITEESANKYYVAFVSLSLVDSDGDGDTDEKTAKFQNTYSAGSLSVTKNVTGNLGDKTKYFGITITLNRIDGKDNYAASYVVKGGSQLEDGETPCDESSIAIGKAKKFFLKDGETLTIENIPYGVTYTVVEDDYTTEENGGYKAPVYSFVDGTVGKTTKEIDSPLETVTITNTKESHVDTGIVLDSLPYVLLIAVAVVGVVIFTARKRSHREY